MYICLSNNAITLYTFTMSTPKAMFANIIQLEAIERLKANFRIDVLDYGHYSDGSIAVHCKDQFGEFSTTVYKNGSTVE